MIFDYFNTTIKSASESVSCFASVDSIYKKEGYDKKVTLYGRKILSHLTEGVYTTATISYIEESDYIKLRKMWISNTMVEVVTDDNTIYRGEITNEELDFKKSLNNIDNIYYYSGTITLEV